MQRHDLQLLQFLQELGCCFPEQLLILDYPTWISSISPGYKHIYAVVRASDSFDAVDVDAVSAPTAFAGVKLAVSVSLVNVLCDVAAGR